MASARRSYAPLAWLVAGALALAFVFGSGRAQAHSSIFVGPHADYAIDLSGRWTIEDVAGPQSGVLFRPADGARPANYGAGHGPYAAMWLRFVVPRELSTQGGLVVLTIRESRIRTFDLYRPQAGGFDIRSWRLGTGGENARLPTRYPTVVLPDSARGETAYIRFHTPSSMRATLWVQNETSYLRTYAAEMMFFGVLFGLLAALLVYFSAAAIGSRDVTTGALAALVLGFIGHILGGQAFLDTFILPGDIAVSRTVSFGSTFVIYTAALIYAYNSLRAEANAPRLARFLRAMIWALAALTAAAVATVVVDITAMRRFSPAIGVATIAAVLALALATAFREPKRATIFLLCWWPALVTGVARVVPDLTPADGFDPVLINLLYPAFATSLLLAGIAAARDIRERERALTRAAEENAARLKAFADSASDSFWETDGAGRIVFSSGPASAVAGLAPGVLVRSVLEGGDGARLRPGEPLTRAPLQKVDATRGLRHLRLSAVPIDGGGWRGIVSDVTDEVVEAERMSQQRRMAAVGQLAGGVAHEINNLLHPMINLSRRAGEALEASDERRRWLDIVRDSGVRAAEIVRALLTSVRPVGGDGRRAPLGAALHDIIDEVRALAPAATRLETRLETRLGPVVPIAEAFQVVANLVTNAVHASRGGHVSIVYARVETARGARFELTVADDGVGMDEATLARASEPFFTTKPQGEGTGLGLSIVQALASKWGGDLSIASRPGEGARVTVSVAAEEVGFAEEGLREDSGR